LLNQRTTATADDLAILTAVFWDKPDQKRDIQRIIYTVSSPEMAKATVLLDKVIEVHTEAMKHKDAGDRDRRLAALEANDKIKAMVAELATLPQSVRVEEVRMKVREMQQQITSQLLRL